MDIQLVKAQTSDSEEILALCKAVFQPFLDKYHDDEINPAAMPLEKVINWLQQDFTTLYLIKIQEKSVGLIRIVQTRFFTENEDKCRISPLGVIPSYQNQGIAQEVFRQIEQLYQPRDGWFLGTILQEKRNIHLYEKLGYRRVGAVKHFNDKMDTVDYEKK